MDICFINVNPFKQVNNIAGDAIATKHWGTPERLKSAQWEILLFIL